MASRFLILWGWLALGALGSLTTSAGAWTTAEVRGLPYISFAEIASYYGFQPSDIDTKQLTLKRPSASIQWTVSASSKLSTLNGLNFYLSYPVLRVGDKGLHLSAFDLTHVIDPILSPSSRREASQLRVVILDAAGGGSEPGVKSRTAQEKELTLDMAKRLQPRLEALGLKTFLTRSEDVDLSLEDRMLLATTQREECLYLSLHSRPAGTGTPGVVTLTLPPSGTPATSLPEGEKPGEQFYEGHINERESMALATAVHGAVVTQKGIQDQGIRREWAPELKALSMPGLVIQLGQLGDAAEGPKLASPGYRDTLASGITQGLKRYATVMAQGSNSHTQELHFESVEVFPDQIQSLKGERVRVRATIAKTPGKPIDFHQVQIQVFFFDRVNREEIDLSTCDPIQPNWISVLPTWKDSDSEIVEFTYQQPPYDATLLKALGRRLYYGFVLRLVHQNRLMAEHSEPPNLKRGLSTFTTLEPR
jgi:N-acetylmuramoyl-L-alanine amidase